MTKKVLISLEDIFHESRIFTEQYFHDKKHWAQEERDKVWEPLQGLKLHFIEWFDAQPDALFSKMKTTGGKNDN